MKQELINRLALYLVTDRSGLDEDTFLQKVEDACRYGVTIVQLREKTISTKDYYEWALKVKKITDTYGIPLIIDDRIDVCLAVGASGVHIGDEDLPVSVARSLLGREKILGVSAKSVARARQAENEGADYLGVGAIFPTQTKVKTRLTSVETLRDISQTVQIPVVAIGGLTVENMTILEGCHLSGIAVVRELMQSNDIKSRCCQLYGKLEKIIGGYVHGDE